MYLAMSQYFARDNVALPGLAKHFKHESDEEREHAEMLMDYQVMRGGRVILGPLGAPPSEFDNAEKGDALHAASLALSLEKLNMDKLLELHAVADKADDCQLVDFLEGELLKPQAESIDEAARMVTQLDRVGKGHGTWAFDRTLE